MVDATDTDVLVLAIVTTTVLEGCRILIAFGHDSKYQCIFAHTFATVLVYVANILLRNSNK